MATPIKWGNGFRVNAITNDDQSAPVVTGLADGRFVAMWTDMSSTLGDGDAAVHGQIFAADGSRIGVEFRVNTGVAGNQYLPDITALSDGRFVASWREDSGVPDVVARIFKPNGTKFGAGDFVVHADAHPGSLATLTNDRFVATWTSLANGNIHAQLYQPDGAKFGGDIIVTTLMDGQPSDPSAAGLSNGRFVATWTVTDPAGDRIRGQLFTHDGGEPGNEFKEFVVSSQPGIDAASVVTALPDGRFVVSWQHTNGNGTVDIHAQVFNADTTRSGAEILVNTTVAGDQVSPAIAALNDGRFVVAWSDLGTHAQVFNLDGTKSGAEFLVSTDLAGVQADPSITVLADGRLVVAWVDSSADGSGIGLNAQIYDPRESGISKTGTDLGDDLIGTDFHDVLKGAGGADRLSGMGGDDFLEGGPGADTLIGGDGIDTASYRHSPDSVFIVLENGAGGFANDGYGQLGDTLSGIENLVGSDFVDFLVGDDGDNVIEGGLGDDEISGEGGDDTAVFSHDFNDYGLTDFGSFIFVSGPDGFDYLASIEHLKFADVTITPVDDGNPLFDTLYYLSRNPDVVHAGMDAFDHFNAFGWHEGRDPNALFDTSEYLSLYQDAAASGMNPLDHYHQLGWQQGHDPWAFFDTRLYLVHNPDVAAAGVDPLAHFLQFGLAEGRRSYEAIGDTIVGGFDAEYYLRHNADVAAAGVDPLLHFNTFGWHEGRNPNAWFDTAGYLAHYADVAAAGVNPLDHYQQFGWQEGRDPSARFDTLDYLAANPDVAAAHVNPLDHFLTFGIYEGREAINDGVWH